MLLIIQLKTPLQIFCECILDSQVIFKSIIDPDDISNGGLLSCIGYPIHTQRSPEKYRLPLSYFSK